MSKTTVGTINGDIIVIFWEVCQPKIEGFIEHTTFTTEEKITSIDQLNEKAYNLSLEVTNSRRVIYDNEKRINRLLKYIGIIREKLIISGIELTDCGHTFDDICVKCDPVEYSTKPNVTLIP